MEDFNPGRAALLLLDFQNYGLHREGYWAKVSGPKYPPAEMKAAVGQAYLALKAARKRGLLVIHVASAWRAGSPEMNFNIPVFARGPDRAVEGSWAVGFFEPLVPIEGEPAIFKRSVSALAGTELDRLLRVRDVNTLLLTGIATNFAVEGTAREAADRGYRVIILEDACASVTPKMHNFSINFILKELCTVSTSGEFIRTLEA